MPKGMWVRIPPSAPEFPPEILSRANEVSRGTPPADLPLGWCTYILVCEDGTYYCGLTRDLAQRILDHSQGKGSGYTKGKQPTTLVWYEPFENRAAAARRERQIKKWGHSKKKALVEGNPKFHGLGICVWVPLG